MGPMWMHAKHGRIVSRKALTVDMILGKKNHLNHIIIAVDLAALIFNNFLGYVFYDIISIISSQLLCLYHLHVFDKRA